MSDRVTNVPYVGVAGFMTAEEIVRAVETIPSGVRHPLAIGILTSAKTLRGEANKYPNRYPQVANIPAITRAGRSAFGERTDVLFVLHYSIDEIGDLDGIPLRTLDKLVTDAGFNALQINATPQTIQHPSFCKNLDWLAADHPNFRVIVQIRPSGDGDSMTTIVNMVLGIARDSRAIKDLIVDGSGGRGKPIDIVKVHALVMNIRASCFEHGFGWHRFTIAVAGGLGPDLLKPVGDLARLLGPLGFDPERNVRDELDHMDIDRMQMFLRQAWMLVDDAVFLEDPDDV
jgi:hypothetical protein